jgi:hypothetical protein
MEMDLSMTTKTKTYNTKVVENDALKLLIKGNFKRRTMCDEFDKFVQNAFKQN